MYINALQVWLFNSLVKYLFAQKACMKIVLIRGPYMVKDIMS